MLSESTANKPCNFTQSENRSGRDCPRAIIGLEIRKDRQHLVTELLAVLGRVQIKESTIHG